MKTIRRFPVPRRAQNFSQTFMPMEGSWRLLHDAHRGYGGFCLRRGRNAIVRAGHFLTVMYSGRRWREVGRG